jgi:DNA polymerase III epsilon subunit-like protein
MKLTPVFLDFESFWSTDHTMSKMSPIEYVMSPKTEIISVAIKVGDYPTDVIFGEDKIRHALNKLDWSNKMAIGHNMSGFDSMILKWRFGIQPAMWGCTAAMARPKYAKTTGVSLKALAKEFGIGAKLELEATNTKGKYLKDFTPEELDAMSEYNKVDTELCAALFKRMVKGFLKDELVLIHLTTQMLVNPQFVLDKGLLEAALSVERANKHKALLDLAKLIREGQSDIEIEWSDEEAVAEFVRSEMASAPRFAKLLESCGVEVPMKPSPTDPTKQVPALAKTDEGFLKLQDHPNPLVASAARTRLSVKSTILEPRLEAFLRAGAACGGKLPVPLKYCGADTTGRWSGEHHNMQNLPRIGSKPKTSDALRNSLKAPKGHKVVVADLSGIELRVNHFLWKVQSSMDLYKSDAEADLYRAFAAARYGITPEEVTKDQRQLAKVAQLGLGFGAGAATFRKVAKLMGGLDLSDEDAEAVTTAWRATYHDIVQGWRRCHDALPDILQGTSKLIDPWGMCETELGAIRLPSGRRIYYPALRTEVDTNGKKEWWYGEGRHKARIYAGKITENCVQALARDVIAGNAIDFWRATRFEPVLMVHDELVYVVPETDAQGALDELQKIMRTPPKWWPELVTWSEGDIADSYGAAK